MNPARPVLILVYGDGGNGAAERMVARVRIASVRQTALSALAAGFERVIVATSEPGRFAGLPHEVAVDADCERFRFGQRVAALVARFGLERPAVAGGSLPLLSVEDLAVVRRALETENGIVVTNNFFSSDLAGWTPGNAIARVSALERDNGLPRQLREVCGLRPVILPRSTRSLFDVDTPADACVLALQDGLPVEIARSLQGHDGEPPLPLAPYRAVMDVICDPRAELVVAGRVGSAAWQHLETETACRVRLISEERGLAAAGAGHRARSVLGYLLEAVGVERFVERLCTLGDAIVLDTRVLEAHLGISPSREDRFQSDLLNPSAITDAFLAELTAAAAAAPKPVLLGGHSLVAGGLMALAEAAWREHDRKAMRER
jgi:CTP:molybdopterin cytidylyltransferase MocA